MYCFDITSTRAKADASRVAEVLGKYEVPDVDFEVDSAGYLQVFCGEGDRALCGHLVALPVGDVPRREDFEDEDEYREVYLDAYDCDGALGFSSLLGELGPCLETPLTILSITADRDGNRASATVFQVMPGSNEADVLDAAADFGYRPDDRGSAIEAGLSPPA